MINFAVSINGVTAEGQGTWVLAVDPAGERFLIVHEDKTMHWHPMAECTFVKAATPDMPTLVYPVQPKQPEPVTRLAMPVPNRAERRAFNGN